MTAATIARTRPGRGADPPRLKAVLCSGPSGRGGGVGRRDLRSRKKAEGWVADAAIPSGIQLHTTDCREQGFIAPFTLSAKVLWSSIEAGDLALVLAHHYSCGTAPVLHRLPPLCPWHPGGRAPRSFGTATDRLDYRFGRTDVKLPSPDPPTGLQWRRPGTHAWVGIRSGRQDRNGNQRRA